jgi:hypothetical protein
MPQICGKGSREDDRTSHTLQDSVTEFSKVAVYFREIH